MNEGAAIENNTEITIFSQSNDEEEDIDLSDPLSDPIFDNDQEDPVGKHHPDFINSIFVVNEDDSADIDENLEDTTDQDVLEDDVLEENIVN